MLSLLDLEGIPRGTGSGSCNTERTGLPDLGTDIGDIPKSFAIYPICAQTQADLVETGDDLYVDFGRRTDAGSSKLMIAQNPVSYTTLLNESKVLKDNTLSSNSKKVMVMVRASWMASPLNLGSCVVDGLASCLNMTVAGIISALSKYPQSRVFNQSQLSAPQSHDQ